MRIFIEQRRVDRLEDLPPRMREVAMLISEGMSRREIARRMVISESTVRNHINAMVKMVGIRHGGRAGLKIANWVWEQRSHGEPRKEPRNDTEGHERGLRGRRLEQRSGGMNTKICRDCGKELPISEFYAKSSGKYGVDTICKPCMRERDRIRRERLKHGGSRNNDEERLRFELKALVGKRERKPARNCDVCPGRDVCAMRVRMGLWVLCERPDEGDMRRLEDIKPRITRMNTNIMEAMK